GDEQGAAVPAHGERVRPGPERQPRLRLAVDRLDHRVRRRVDDADRVAVRVGDVEELAARAHGHTARVPADRDRLRLLPPPADLRPHRAAPLAGAFRAKCPAHANDPSNRHWAIRTAPCESVANTRVSDTASPTALNAPASPLAAAGSASVCLTAPVARSMNTRSRMFLATSVRPPSMTSRSTGRPGNVTCRPAGRRSWLVGTRIRPSGWRPTLS